MFNFGNSVHAGPPIPPCPPGTRSPHCPIPTTGPFVPPYPGGINVLGASSYVHYSTFLPPLPLPKLQGPLVKKEQETLRPPRKSTRYSRGAWRSFIWNQTFVDPKGRVRVMDRPRKLMVAEKPKDHDQAKRARSLGRTYMQKKFGNKIIWNYTGGDLECPENRFFQRHKPYLLPPLDDADRATVVGPFRRLAIMYRNRRTSIDRLRALGLETEVRAMGLNEKGRRPERKRRSANYLQGKNLPGMSPLRSEVLPGDDGLVEEVPTASILGDGETNHGDAEEIPTASISGDGETELDNAEEIPTASISGDGETKLDDTEESKENEGEEELTKSEHPSKEDEGPNENEPSTEEIPATLSSDSGEAVEEVEEQSENVEDPSSKHTCLAA